MKFEKEFPRGRLSRAISISVGKRKASTSKENKKNRKKNTMGKERTLGGDQFARLM